MGSVEDISEIGPPTFGTTDKITDASLMPPARSQDYDFDKLYVTYPDFSIEIN